MSLIEEKLWQILEISSNKELNPVSMEHLKAALGTFFAKYIYDKDLSYTQFIKWINADIEYKRIDKIKLLDNLSKIYQLHRDYDIAIELKEKMLEICDKNTFAKESYTLASWLLQRQEYKHALKTIAEGIESIGSKNLTKDSLKLLLESVLMRGHLKIILEYSKDETDNELDTSYKLIKDTAQYLSTQEVDSLLVELYSLITSNNINQKEYKKAILIGEKALDMIDKKDLTINTILKYYLFEKLGFAYLFQSQYENAIEISKKTLSLKDKFNTLPIYSALVILVESYVAQKEYDEALRYAHEANSYVNNSTKKLTYIYEMLSKIYSLKGDINSSKEYEQKLQHLEEGIKQIV